MSLLLFVRKTLGDCARPRLLIAFLVPYLGIAVLLATLLGGTGPDNLGSAPLFTQEQALIELYSQLSFVWLVTFPLLFVAVLAAIVVAGEAEQGTLRILLSKPVRRWELLVGKFLGITIFGVLSIVAGLFVGAVSLWFATGASPMALGDSVLALLPGTVVYGLLVTVFVAALGSFVGVYTGSQLKTMLVAALVPVLFFVSVFLNFLPIEEIYERYYLYVPDVSYHFGNLYVFVQGMLGPEFTPETQTAFATVSGIYDTGSAWHDPLVGGIVGSVPLAGHVPPAVSGAVVLLFGIALIVGALLWFERMDIQ